MAEHKRIWLSVRMDPGCLPKILVELMETTLFVISTWPAGSNEPFQLNEVSGFIVGGKNGDGSHSK